MSALSKKKKILFAFFLPAIFLFLSFFVSFLVVNFYPAEKIPLENAGLAVVLGAGITIDSEPSVALQLRLDKALELFSDGKVSNFFVSGLAPEVFVMQSYLKANEIGAEKILPDTNAVRTFDTVENVYRYCISNKVSSGVIFVSQRYHLPRVRLYAKRVGFEEIYFVSSDYKDVDLENYFELILRETAALLRAFFFDHPEKARES